MLDALVRPGFPIRHYASSRYPLVQVLGPNPDITLPVAGGKQTRPDGCFPLRDVVRKSKFHKIGLGEA